jgi:predicted amidohydrolase
MRFMRIAAANYPIQYHSSLEEWKEYVKDWINQLDGKKIDVAVFPEYGSIELVSLLSKELQNDLVGQIKALEIYLQDFKEHYAALAKDKNICIVAPSYPIHHENRVINRAYVFSPSGKEGYQDKLFMTPFESNEWGVSAGEPVLTVFKTIKGSFGIQICYDSEFSIGSHELVKAGAEIILLPSCTETLKGATRVHIAGRARALENQCYTVVSQTIGEALWSPAVDYNYGYCAAYSTPDLGFPDLGILQEGQHQESGWMIQEFDLTLLQKVREYGGVLNHKDSLAVTSLLNGQTIKVNVLDL